MAVDRIETTWHLPPDGWVEGLLHQMFQSCAILGVHPKELGPTWVRQLPN